MRARVADVLAAAAVVLWPFLYLFPYILPVGGKYLAIGNDFQILYFGYKAYLLDSLARFDVPWWSPSEAAGFPFYASPFTETFYPLNLPLTAFYKVVDGYRLLDHQRFTVLAISIFALGLFCWLRSLRFSTRTALAAAMVMSVSFKITEILRFPNALHTAAWYPWVLLFMTRLAGSTTRRSQALNAAMLAGALLCMVTGGYPYYVLYSPWLFGPYLLVLLVPRWSKALLDREPVAAARVLPAFAIAAVAVALACGPFLYKMSALMKQTSDRGGQSFEYSTAYVFNYQDTIGSWLFPPAAQFEGWYYFGIINVMLVALAVARRPRNPLPWLLLAWVAIISYITYGKSSYLFAFLWHYVPPYSSLRVWGRMNIILVPILAWLVAIAYQHFESLVAGRDPEHEHEHERERSRWNWRPLVLLSAIAGAILAAQFYVRGHGWHDEYWVRYYTGWITLGYSVFALLKYLEGWGLQTGLTQAQMMDIGERVFMAAAVVSFLALAFMLLLSPWLRRSSAWGARIVLTMTVAIAAIDMWIVGPWAWAYAVLPALPRQPYQIAQRNAQSFIVPRIAYPGMSPDGPFAVGFMPNWYFERYVRFRREGQREPEAMNQLLGMVDGRKVLFSERIDHASIQAFLDDSRRFSGVERVTAYTGDELSVSVSAPSAGYVSFIDNWDPDWTASVDAAAVPIERLFGTFKAVPVRAGAHTVEFAYRPFGAWQ
jgi:hypothetical protein